jgi:hypothetical protein
MKKASTSVIVLCALLASLLSYPAAGSATVLTSGGSAYTGEVRIANVENEQVQLDASGVKCDLVFEAQVETHPRFVVSKWNVKGFAFSNCGESVTVTSNGAGTAYLGAAGLSAILVLSGTTITIVNHVLGTSCNYIANTNNSMGLMQSSAHTEGTATGSFSGRFVYESGGALCNEYATLTGNFIVDTPDELNWDT